MTPRFAVAAWFAVLPLLGACGHPRPPAEPENDSETAPSSSDATPPPPPTPAAPSIYERLGKRDGLSGIVEELLGNVLADNRISKLFDKSRKDKNRSKQLSNRLVAELCVIAGGGGDCAYDGKSMKDAHAGLAINGAQWDAFMEDLGIAMKTRGVDDATAKELADQLTQKTRADIVGGKGK